MKRNAKRLSSATEVHTEVETEASNAAVNGGKVVGCSRCSGRCLTWTCLVGCWPACVGDWESDRFVHLAFLDPSHARFRMKEQKGGREGKQGKGTSLRNKKEKGSTHRSRTNCQALFHTSLVVSYCSSCPRLLASNAFLLCSASSVFAAPPSQPWERLGHLLVQMFRHAELPPVISRASRGRPKFPGCGGEYR